MKNIEYYNNLDKRSKEYRDWKKQTQPKGIGDVVESITKATGIKKGIELILGKDCGCDERKEMLNRLLPIEKKITMTEDQRSVFEKISGNIENTKINYDTRESIRRLYNEVLRKKESPTKCGKCVKNQYQKLMAIYLNEQ